MRRLGFVLLPLLALAGCATGPGLQSRMAAYIGASDTQLIQSLGVPDKQITADGVSYYAYVRQQAQLQPDPFWGAGFGPWGRPIYGGGFYGAGLPRDIQVWSCETTFELRNGKVQGVTFKGNDCS